MKQVDLERFICSLMKVNRLNTVNEALKEQGFEYLDGKIKPIDPFIKKGVWYMCIKKYDEGYFRVHHVYRASQDGQLTDNLQKSIPINNPEEYFRFITEDEYPLRIRL